MGKDRSSLVGRKFHRLTVLAFHSKDESNNRRWLCRCECGVEKILLGSNLKSGDTKSCGCLKKELNSCWNIIHGQSRKTTYRIWDGMRRRCGDPQNPQYRWYGAKGVTVCDKWQKFAGFFEDMGERPPSMTIDRIDSNGNYEKANCRWSTMTDNLRNRSSVKLTVQKAQEIRDMLAAKAYTQKEIARFYGVDPSIISNINTNKYWVV